jgi:hypothetical protein
VSQQHKSRTKTTKNTNETNTPIKQAANHTIPVVSKNAPLQSKTTGKDQQKSKIPPPPKKKKSTN